MAQSIEDHFKPTIVRYIKRYARGDTSSRGPAKGGGMATRAVPAAFLNETGPSH